MILKIEKFTNTLNNAKLVMVKHIFNGVKFERGTMKS
jgi:hypothetical protein